MLGCQGLGSSPWQLPALVQEAALLGIYTLKWRVGRKGEVHLRQDRYQ